MIDLHIHTTYSDGSNSVRQILEKAEEKKLEIISITDHNTCKAYEELSNIDISKHFSGKILKGVELNTTVLGLPIEILGYGINPIKMNEIISKTYLTSKERNMYEFKNLYNACLKNNIILPENTLEGYDGIGYASAYLHSHIIKDIRNKEIGNIDDDAWNNVNGFYRKYLSNPKSIFFVDTTKIVPDIHKCIEMVKEAGGITFLAHVYEYGKNTEKILDYVLNNTNIDGIETYYTTFSDDKIKTLEEAAKKHNKYISGGSDYHGDLKPTVDIGGGYGNLKIPKDIILNWIDKMI